MPRAYRKDVSCTHCGAAIITDGKLTCPRCHESVDIASSKDVTRDEEGRWKCQKCLEHGRPSKTLAVGDEIQCRVCPEKTKNYLFEKEPEMPRAAEVETQGKSGPTKLTTEEYNALLRKWLQDAKQRKRELERSLRKTPVLDEIRIGQEPPAEKKIAERILAEVKRRIETLEKAIALGFDPDEFERVMNIPLRAIVNQPLPTMRTILFKGRMINRLTGRLHLQAIYIEATTEFVFYPLSRFLEIDIVVETAGINRTGLLSHAYREIEGFKVENASDSSRAIFYTDGHEIIIRSDGLVRGLLNLPSLLTDTTV